MAAATSTLRLASSAFQDGGFIPAAYTCDGDGISPPLLISGVPDKTVSLALIVEDPDAPRGTWDHWVVFNIDPTTAVIKEGVQPSGVAGKGSAGNTEYAGPCPPSGTHRYIFSLFALDTKLSLPAGSSKASVLQAIEGHVLAEAKLTGRYARK